MTPKEWNDKIQDALKYRQKVSEKQGWNRILQEYEGDYKLGQSATTTQTPNNATPPINLVYGYVRTAIPSLYFKDPYISVNAKGASYIQKAHIIEKVINYLISEIKLKKEIVRIIMDALLIGHGWIKLGYSGNITQADLESREEQSKNKQPDSPLVSKLDKEIVDKQTKTTNELIKNEEIFAVYVPWDDIIFDVKQSKDPPYDCKWIAHRITKPLEEVKDSELYENTENLKSNISLDGQKNKSQEDDLLNKYDTEMVEYWEIYDKKNNKLIVMAPGHDKFLREDDFIYEINPYSMLKFNLVPGKPYPLSDIFLIEPQILEKIKLRASQLNHIKRWNRQLIIDKGAFDDQNKQKFILGIDGAVIEKEPGKNPPIPVEYANMQSEIFAIDNLITQDMDGVIGQLDVERGGPARTTTKKLGELTAQLSGNNNSHLRRQDILEDFIEEVASKIISLLKQFQDIPRFVKITGMNNATIEKAMGNVSFDGSGIHVTKEHFEGDYDIEAKAGTTLPLNKQTRISLLEGLLTLSPQLGLLPGGPVTQSIGRELLRELDIQEVEQAFDEEEQIRKNMPPQPLPQLPLPKKHIGPHNHSPRPSGKTVPGQIPNAQGPMTTPAP